MFLMPPMLNYNIEFCQKKNSLKRYQLHDRQLFADLTFTTWAEKWIKLPPQLLIPSGIPTCTPYNTFRSCKFTSIGTKCLSLIDPEILYKVSASYCSILCNI